MKTPKTLLFAHPRSGSTTLMHALNTHPNIKLLHEPFNEERQTWQKGNINYLERVHTRDDLGMVLEEIHEHYTGFKHLHYQLPEALTRLLLLECGYHSIFLYRKNYLQTIVSALISEQTGVWTHEERVASTEPFVYTAFNLDELEKQLVYLKEDTELYRHIANESGQPVYEIAYEDLYTGNLAHDLVEIEKIFSFLSLSISTTLRKTITPFLSSGRKMTSEVTYAQIPNIDEVEARFGSDIYGHLFT